MKALVLAAGLGTRLGALTSAFPKCLIEVAGKTMLERVIERLKQASITEAVINLHHCGQQIREFVDLKKNFGIKIFFSFEADILDTGGAVKYAASHFSDGDFVIHNSDVYSELDLRLLIDAHKRSRSAATLAVMARPSDRVLLFDTEERLIGYENRKTGNRVVVRETASEQALGFSGIQVCSPKIFKVMESLDSKFSIITAYMNLEREGEPVRAYRMDKSYWIDMGTPERLAELQAHLSKQA